MADSLGLLIEASKHRQAPVWYICTSGRGVRSQAWIVSSISGSSTDVLYDLKCRMDRIRRALDVGAITGSMEIVLPEFKNRGDAVAFGKQIAKAWGVPFFRDRLPGFVED
jgi:hypothetical protein